LSVCYRHFCTVVSFPAKPSAIEIDKGVHFGWGASSGVVDGYRIYWGTVEGGPYPFRLCDVEKEKLEYITSLGNEHAFYLVCRGYNSVGESENSNEVCWPK
jgi:hypothetical protein